MLFICLTKMVPLAFKTLFEKGNQTLIFKFLDEETSFSEDLQVIWKCPKGLFLKAFFARIFRL